MVSRTDATKREAAILRAVEMVTSALDLLDAHSGPPEASAHLALALESLRGATAAGREA
jgi:hypothetical protein